MPKSFKELEKLWYNKIKKKGFEDIENTDNPDKPLKTWDSFKLPSQKSQTMQLDQAQYQQRIESFQEHPNFVDICKSLVKHGNSKFKYPEVMLIWAFHVDGYTRREMAKQVKRSKSRVDDIIKGLRQWMQIS